jgi:hypothetical protein
MTKPRSTRAQWVARIKTMHRKTAHAFLALGRTLLAAKKALPHDEFLKMIERDLPFTASTAQRLMKVASDRKLSNAAHVRLLPAAWGTLCELTRVPEKTFTQAITSGAVHPKMTRRDAIRLVKVSYEQKPPTRVIEPEVSARTIANAVRRFEPLFSPAEVTAEAVPLEEYASIARWLHVLSNCN